MSTSTPSVYIRGLGVYTPGRRLTNEELSKTVDTTDEWIRTRSGIAERRVAAAGENTSDMGVAAAKSALARAGLTPADIDLVICATMTPDMPFPSTACLIAAKLGMRETPAFDITAACSGFIYLLQVGGQMIRSGAYRNVLVVGAEKMSSVIDWQDRGTCVLFGDGAGAAVLSATQVPGVGIVGCTLGADGSNPELLYCPAGGSAKPASAETVANREHYLRMNGKEIFKQAARVMASSCQRVLDEHGVAPGEVTCVVPHQANMRIIEAVAKLLALDLGKFHVNLDRFGNTSAASIPIALEEAWLAKRFKAGDHVLLVAFGAGLTWGSALIKWHEQE